MIPAYLVAVQERGNPYEDGYSQGGLCFIQHDESVLCAQTKGG